MLRFLTEQLKHANVADHEIRGALVHTIAGQGGCILFVGYRKSEGYSALRHNGMERRRHCLAYEIRYGEYDRVRLQINHTCDTPNCVNPWHLYAGTHQQNMADKTARNRAARGSRVNTNVLTEAQVLEIVDTQGTYASIARKYRVGESTIRQIKHGESWAWLTGVAV